MKNYGSLQPKIIAAPERIDDGNKGTIWKPSSPAIILPINAFGQTLTPSIDKDAYPTNVSASIGRTAYLKCRIQNLGHKSVREIESLFTTIFKQIINFFIDKVATIWPYLQTCNLNFFIFLTKHIRDCYMSNSSYINRKYGSTDLGVQLKS